MKEKSTEREWESRPTWEDLEAFARRGSSGCCSGWWRKRSIACWGGSGMNDGRPRVRGLAARFGSRPLPLFKRRPEAVGRLLPDLYSRQDLPVATADRGCPFCAGAR